MRILFVVIVGVLLGTAGCGKKTKPTGQPTSDTTVTPGPGGGVVVGTPLSGGGGGGGAVQAVRGAVVRAVTQNDMHQIQLFIENASSASGKMPTPAETYAALKQEAPNIYKLVEDGTIVLHPARTREDVWAYERKAYDSRGWVLSGSGIEQMDSQTLRQRLGQ